MYYRGHTHFPKYVNIQHVRTSNKCTCSGLSQQIWNCFVLRSTLKYLNNGMSSLSKECFKTYMGAFRACRK
jgi:hypothetical protein